jgi:hypothetical protein
VPRERRKSKDHHRGAEIAEQRRPPTLKIRDEERLSLFLCDLRGSVMIFFSARRSR